MKVLLSVLTILVGLPAARAQAPVASRGESYAIVAPFAQPLFGGRATYVAAGGEFFLYKGASIVAEVGPVISHTETGGTYAFGLGSANAAYHFSRASKVMDPFVTLGYSTTFRAGIASGSNVGAGISFFQKRKIALRFELRGYLGKLRIEQVGPRFGVTFR